MLTQKWSRRRRRKNKKKRKKKLNNEEDEEREKYPRRGGWPTAAGFPRHVASRPRLQGADADVSDRARARASFLSTFGLLTFQHLHPRFWPFGLAFSLLDFGFWILNWFWIRDFGFWIRDLDFWILDFEILAFGLAFRLLLLDFGFWIWIFNWFWDFGFWILNRFWIRDFGFWI